MPISTSLILTTKSGNKTKSMNITHANPNATNENLTTFAASLMSLSQNQFVSLERVNKEELTVPTAAAKEDPNFSISVAAPGNAIDYGTLTKNSDTDYSLTTGGIKFSGTSVIEVTRLGDGALSASTGTFTGNRLEVYIEDKATFDLTITLAETDTYSGGTITVHVTDTGVTGGDGPDGPDSPDSPE